MSLFQRLDNIARRRGIWGRFELRSVVEHATLPLDEVVECLVRQRLAANPAKHLTFPWGSVGYRELSSPLGIVRSRLYGPQMLYQTFGWESDLPTWDGIVCKVGKLDQYIDEVSEPIALLWCNESGRAVAKRSWSPVDVVGAAMSQIPAGEFGVVYVAYQEGARAEVANRRLDAFTHRMHEWEHSGKIRVPAVFLVRLYPRTLENGLPDLIESTVVMYPEYAGLEISEDFPGLVFGSHRYSNGQL